MKRLFCFVFVVASFHSFASVPYPGVQTVWPGGMLVESQRFGFNCCSAVSSLSKPDDVCLWLGFGRAIASQDYYNHNSNRVIGPGGVPEKEDVLSNAYLWIACATEKPESPAISLNSESQKRLSPDEVEIQMLVEGDWGYELETPHGYRAPFERVMLAGSNPDKICALYGYRGGSTAHRLNPEFHSHWEVNLWGAELAKDGSYSSFKALSFTKKITEKDVTVPANLFLTSITCKI